MDAVRCSVDHSVGLYCRTSRLGGTECGRQPWAIRDMLPTSVSISKLDVGSVQTTFFIFLVLFTVMLIAEIGIMVREIKKGPTVNH